MDTIPFFPNPFTIKDYQFIISDNNREINAARLGFGRGYHFINSGSNGIALLLKSFQLHDYARVGLSPLVCKSVLYAIYKAGLKPYYFDISANYQIGFNEKIFDKSNIGAMILPHFYGSANPDTERIINWCKDNSVFLINDAAQSFGLELNGKPLIEQGNGGIYSFGPGKSSSCAGGAIIFGLDKIRYNSNSLAELILAKNAESILKERISEIEGHYSNSSYKKLKTVFFRIYPGGYYGINYLQFNAVNHFIRIKESICRKRLNNWQILKYELNDEIFEVPKPYYDMQNYKFVFYLELPDKAIQKFIKESRAKGININLCARIKLPGSYRSILPNYFKLRNKLCELSTEASIPEQNIFRAARIMNNYFE